MGLDCERVSFIARIVFAKFRVILSSFDPSRGVVCNLGKIECFFSKNFNRRKFGFVGKVSLR